MCSFLLEKNPKNENFTPNNNSFLTQKNQSHGKTSRHLDRQQKGNNC